MDIPHRYEGRGIRQWISGTRNADDAETFASLDEHSGPLNGLDRGEHLARYAGPRFVGAVKLSDTVATLDITSGSNRQMCPAELRVGLFGKAWMCLDKVFASSTVSLMISSQDVNPTVLTVLYV
jgi:hypothetical protein